MALPNEGQTTTPLPPPLRRFRRHALFSYAAGDKDFVDAVHEALPKDAKVFNYKKEPIWGRKLGKELERIYTKEAPFCVVFISRFYLDSKWTEQELAVVARVEEKKPGYMLPVVLDDTTLPVIKDLAWLEDLTPAEVAERLVAKICEPPRKPWWFYLSTEVKVAIAVALLALILAVYFLRPTRTEVRSVQVTEQAITAHVVKGGPVTKSAAIVGQRLKFGSVPIEDAELRLDKSAAAITRGNQDVTLTVLGLDPKCVDGYRRNSAEIEPLLGEQEITLVLDVRESDDAPGRSTPRTMTLPAARLKPFVRKWVAGNENPDC